MIQSFGEALDHETLRCNRSFAFIPGLGLRNIDRRKFFRTDIGQRRLNPGGCIQRQAGGVATGEIISCTDA